MRSVADFTKVVKRIKDQDANYKGTKGMIVRSYNWGFDLRISSNIRGSSSTI